MDKVKNIFEQKWTGYPDLLIFETTMTNWFLFCAFEPLEWKKIVNNLFYPAGYY